MSDDAVFLIYALLFRFGIIAAGICAMVMGCYLLRDAESSEGTASGIKSTAEASIPGARIKIKNVTAGSIFALFGALLIVAMVLQGNPEKTTQRESGGGNTSESEKVRGGAGDSLMSTTIQSAIDAQHKGETDEAERLFREVLTRAAPALNGIAWIYARGSTPERGLSFSKTAVDIDNTNADYWDTLAEVELRIGDQASALDSIQKAANLDQRFKPRVNEFRRRANR